MRRLFVFGNTYGYNSLQVYQLRQGLLPLHDVAAPFAFPATMTGVGNATYALIDINPARTAAVVNHGQNAATMSIVRDLSGAATPVDTPGVSIGGYAYASSISNNLVAWGGTGSRLIVCQISDMSVLTVSTTGLGDLNCLQFSPDGTKLAVSHVTTPYLRVYDTATWAYTDAPIADRYVYSIGWTPDSTKFVTCHNTSSSTLNIWDSTLTSRLASLSSSTYYGSYATFIPKPGTPNTLVMFGAAGNAAYARVLEVDTAANTATAQNSGLIAGEMFRPRAVVYDSLNQQYIYASRLDGRVRMLDSDYVNIPDADRFIDVYTGSLTNSGIGLSIQDDGLFSISGTVRDVANTPAARVVRAYRRADGVLMAQTTSDAVTGDYTLYLPDIGPYDVQFQIASGELLNDLFFARAEPAPVT